MNKFNTGLVVGKFCPMSLGHEYLIETAMSQCKTLIVLSYTTQKFDYCSVQNRRDWLNYRFAKEIQSGQMIVKVIDPLGCPQDDDPEYDHRQFCCEQVRYLGKSIQAIFTSESYGDGFAEHASKFFANDFDPEFKVNHICVDIHRVKYPISGTQLRKDSSLHDMFVSDHVRSYFSKKVLILGGESSGKTTLTRALAMDLNCNHVEEFGREMYDRRAGKLLYEDMEYIATEQLIKEMQAVRTNYDRGFVICDTSPLTTLFYSYKYFFDASKQLESMSDESLDSYEFIILCKNDFDFVQDGTRKDSTFRDAGYQFYLNNLNAYGIPFLEVYGSVENRVAMVKEYISAK